MRYLLTDGRNADFRALCVLLEASLEEAVGATVQRSKYRAFNTLDKIGDAVVVYNGAEPVACGGFRPYEDGAAEIKRVFVKKEYRRLGISKRLMLMLENRARDLGYRALVLETNRLLAAAVSLYAGLGYEIIGNYGPYRDIPESICMRKSLESPEASR
jgi:GNAT superfamily N-acetyltransferase